MRCPKCETELSPDDRFCPYCENPQQSVQVLTPEERVNFNGVTIDSSHPESASLAEQSDTPQPHIFMKQITFKPAGWLPKLLFGMGLVALIIFALPLLLFVGAFLGITILIIKALTSNR